MDAFDRKTLERQIPSVSRHCFLDSAAQGPKPAASIALMQLLLNDVWFNGPNTKDVLERQRKELENARRILANTFNVQSDCLACGRSVGEMTWAVLTGLQWEPGDEILISEEENPALYIPVMELAKRKKLTVHEFVARSSVEGIIADVKKKITSRTKTLLCSHVTYVSGTKMPVRQICAIANKAGVVSIVDGAQACGQFKVDFQDIGCTFYLCSGYKWLMGYHGTSLLFMKKAWLSQLEPCFVGHGSESEFDYIDHTYKLRSDAQKLEFGTRFWPAYCALGESVNYLNQLGFENIWNRIQELSLYCKEKMSRVKGLVLLSPADPDTASGICSFTMENMDMDKMLSWLWCEKQIVMHSHPAPWSRVNERCIRVAVNFFNDKSDVDHLIDSIEEYQNLFGNEV